MSLLLAYFTNTAQVILLFSFYISTDLQLRTIFFKSKDQIFSKHSQLYLWVPISKDLSELFVLQRKSYQAFLFIETSLELIFISSIQWYTGSHNTDGVPQLQVWVSLLPLTAIAYFYKFSSNFQVLFCLGYPNKLRMAIDFLRWIDWFVVKPPPKDLFLLFLVTLFLLMLSLYLLYMTF